MSVPDLKHLFTGTYFLGGSININIAITCITKNTLAVGGELVH